MMVRYSSASHQISGNMSYFFLDPIRIQEDAAILCLLQIRKVQSVQVQYPDLMVVLLKHNIMFLMMDSV